MVARGRSDLEPVFLGWRDAARVSGLSVTSLRRLVAARVITAPLLLAGSRKAFRAATFLRELDAHVERLNRNSAGRSPETNPAPAA